MGAIGSDNFSRFIEQLSKNYAIKGVNKHSEGMTVHVEKKADAPAHDIPTLEDHNVISNFFRSFSPDPSQNTVKGTFYILSNKGKAADRSGTVV